MRNRAETEASLRQIAQLLKGSQENVGSKVQQVLEKNRKLEKELEQLKGKLASSAGSELTSAAGGFLVRLWAIPNWRS